MAIWIFVNFLSTKNTKQSCLKNNFAYYEGQISGRILNQYRRYLRILNFPLAAGFRLDGLLPQIGCALGAFVTYLQSLLFGRLDLVVCQ